MATFVSPSSTPSWPRARPGCTPPAPDTTPATLLLVDEIGYRYPGARSDALGSVSFELRRGEILAVVGANGSGKTTLAKLLCGLLPPTRGTIRWNGTDLGGCAPYLVRTQIAPVFQDYARYMLTHEV